MLLYCLNGICEVLKVKETEETLSFKDYTFFWYIESYFIISTIAIIIANHIMIILLNTFIRIS